jgi:hypothetical protein
MLHYPFHLIYTAQHARGRAGQVHREWRSHSALQLHEVAGTPTVVQRQAHRKPDGRGPVVQRRANSAKLGSDSVCPPFAPLHRPPAP